MIRPHQAVAAGTTKLRLAALILLLAMPAQSARPNEACIGVLAESIATWEGARVPGSVAQRFNNPGCLRGRDGRYLRFDTALEGWKRLRAEIRHKLRSVGLDVMLARWSETPGYAEKIRRIAGKQFDFCR